MYRINKAISRLGICTRKQADKLILDKQVYLNGHLIEDFSTEVSIGDTIIVSKKHYKFIPPKTELFGFYKPKGCITSRFDPNGRPTIYDALKGKYKNLITIGRLDFNTEGLILFTNDGEFARFMEIPSSKIERIYHVRAFGFLSQKKMIDISDKAFHGITIDNINYDKVILKYDGNPSFINDDKKKNHKLTIKIFEGKNREVRKILSHFGLEVNRLIRHRFSEYSLNDIHPTQMTKLTIKPSLMQKFNLYNTKH
ncbi:pseudouridine synthase [Candidatus Deianiraea vastatrix]|uniref:Pseudouridine synthase n=1 Tax=Candidatus Deianiraea vastatrix TaxID=2163644 RepID=A0A5B8XHY9_9RICK|nr:pseudouridine synthase [Candidatus Deianiraea vastatrix]QED23661.1 Ribosomal large subunit pseudouridine synthase B [Candidatus Deianiraea vastatrix]